MAEIELFAALCLYIISLDQQNGSDLRSGAQ